LHEAVVKTPRTRAMLLRRIRTLADEYLRTSYFGVRLAALRGAIEADVLRDRSVWGPQAHFPGGIYSLAQALARIQNEYLAPRLGYLTGTAIPGIGTAMPAAQAADAGVRIAEVESLPVSERASEQYVRLDNPGAVAVDVSGWRIEGDGTVGFRPGTVVPAGGVLYVCGDVVGFRSRASGARGGQGLFVQGGLDRPLPAWSGELVVRDAAGRAVDGMVYRADGDSDGMPDVWERAQGLDPGMDDGAGDPDGDGLMNRAEFVAGTGAKDAQSSLLLECIRQEDGSVDLSFDARLGRGYRLLAADDLAGGGWEVLAEVVNVGTVKRQHVVDGQPSTPGRYYRVECWRRGLGGD
jgi:hypothetical protein